MLSFIPLLAVSALSLTACAPLFGTGSLELSQLTQVSRLLMRNGRAKK